MEEKPNLFVGLKDPREVRRNLLEASKSTVTSIQTSQKIRNLQTERDEAKKQLRDDIKELKMLFLRLEKLFPKDVFKKNKQLALPEIKETKSDDPIQKEVDKLHSQLSVIEDKLKNIE